MPPDLPIDPETRQHRGDRNLYRFPLRRGEEVVGVGETGRGLFRFDTRIFGPSEIPQKSGVQYTLDRQGVLRRVQKLLRDLPVRNAVGDDAQSTGEITEVKGVLLQIEFEPARLKLPAARPIMNGCSRIAP